MCLAASFHAKYKVLDKIGEGSFSEVLRCQDRQSGLLYAAKRLKRIYQSVAEILESAEVMVMRKIQRQPNVLCMLEAYYEMLPGRVSLVFELMDMSLYDLMRDRKGRPIPEARVKGLLYQLLRGIEHLHRHGLFHRDIKPENILLKGSTLKIADLGSVRRVEKQPPGAGARAAYTEYISTRWYRSPECLLTPGFYGPKMDVWAAGCVFYELLTLQPLFPGENELDQISKIHSVLGSPHPRLLAKFRRHLGSGSGSSSKRFGSAVSRAELQFPVREVQGLAPRLPRLSSSGLEALQAMLLYDPDSRAAASSLLEHRYFADLRLREAIKQTRSSIVATNPQRQHQQQRQQQQQQQHWRSPSLATYLQQRTCQLVNAARSVESTPTAASGGIPARLEQLRQTHVGRYFLRKRPNNRLQSPPAAARREQRPPAVRPTFFLHEHREHREPAKPCSQLPSIFLKPNLKMHALTSTCVLDHSRQTPAPPRKRASIRSPLKKLPRREHDAHRRLRLIH